MVQNPFLEDPYRATLPSDAGNLLQPGTMKVPYPPIPAIVIPGPTNIVSPVLLDPMQGVQSPPDPVYNPAPGLASDNVQLIVTPQAPVTVVPDSVKLDPIAWAKANPIKALALAVAAYYVGKELFKPNRKQ